MQRFMKSLTGHQSDTGGPLGGDTGSTFDESAVKSPSTPTGDVLRGKSMGRDVTAAAPAGLLDQGQEQLLQERQWDRQGSKQGHRDIPAELLDVSGHDKGSSDQDYHKVSDTLLTPDTLPPHLAKEHSWLSSFWGDRAYDRVQQGDVAEPHIVIERETEQLMGHVAQLEQEVSAHRQGAEEAEMLRARAAARAAEIDDQLKRELPQQRQTLKQQQEAAQAELARLDAARHEALARVKELEGELGRLVEDEQALLQHRLEAERLHHETESSRNGSAARVDELKHLTGQLADKAKAAEAAVAAAAAEVERSERALDEARRRLSAAEAERDGTISALAAAETDRQSVSKELSELEAERQSQLTRLAEWESTIKVLWGQLQDLHGQEEQVRLRAQQLTDEAERMRQDQEAANRRQQELQDEHAAALARLGNLDAAESRLSYQAAALAAQAAGAHGLMLSEEARARAAEAEAHGLKEAAAALARHKEALAAAAAAAAAAAGTGMAAAAGHRPSSPDTPKEGVATPELLSPVTPAVPAAAPSSSGAAPDAGDRRVSGAAATGETVPGMLAPAAAGAAVVPIPGVAVDRLRDRWGPIGSSEQDLMDEAAVAERSEAQLPLGDVQYAEPETPAHDTGVPTLGGTAAHRDLPTAHMDISAGVGRSGGMGVPAVQGAVLDDGSPALENAQVLPAGTTAGIGSPAVTDTEGLPGLSDEVMTGDEAVRRGDREGSGHRSLGVAGGAATAAGGVGAVEAIREMVEDRFPGEQVPEASGGATPVGDELAAQARLAGPWLQAGVSAGQRDAEEGVARMPPVGAAVPASGAASPDTAVAGEPRSPKRKLSSKIKHALVDRPLQLVGAGGGGKHRTTDTPSSPSYSTSSNVADTPSFTAGAPPPAIADDAAGDNHPTAVGGGAPPAAGLSREDSAKLRQHQINEETEAPFRRDAAANPAVEAADRAPEIPGIEGNAAQRDKHSAAVAAGAGVLGASAMNREASGERSLGKDPFSRSQIDAVAAEAADDAINNQQGGAGLQQQQMMPTDDDNVPLPETTSPDSGVMPVDTHYDHKGYAELMHGPSFTRRRSGGKVAREIARHEKKADQQWAREEKHMHQFDEHADRQAAAAAAAGSAADRVTEAANEVEAVRADREAAAGYGGADGIQSHTQHEARQAEKELRQEERHAERELKQAERELHRDVRRAERESERETRAAERAEAAAIRAAEQQRQAAEGTLKHSAHTRSEVELQLGSAAQVESPRDAKFAAGARAAAWGDTDREVHGGVSRDADTAAATPTATDVTTSAVGTTNNVPLGTHPGDTSGDVGSGYLAAGYTDAPGVSSDVGPATAAGNSSLIGLAETTPASLASMTGSSTAAGIPEGEAVSDNQIAAGAAADPNAPIGADALPAKPEFRTIRSALAAQQQQHHGYEGTAAVGSEGYASGAGIAGTADAPIGPDLLPDKPEFRTLRQSLTAQGQQQHEYSDAAATGAAGLVDRGVVRRSTTEGARADVGAVGQGYDTPTPGEYVGTGQKPKKGNFLKRIFS